MLTDRILSDIISAIKDAGEIILSADKDRGGVAVDEKSGSSNFVTQYDVAVQNFLIERIGKILPEAVFLAEEKANDDSAARAECCIIIDPIDGTANFINGYRHSSISVAILNSGDTVFGAVYTPYNRELFTAVKGGGAKLNGNPISVVERPIERAMVAFGTTPYAKDTMTDKTFELMRRFFLNANDLRRLGSAALDLAYLAAGRNDIFFEAMLQPWDFAAGALLVTEAGGIITDMNGSPLVPGRASPILATTKNLHGTALELCKGIL